MQYAETTLHRDMRLEEAIRFLESHADFPRVQVRMRDLLEEAERDLETAEKRRASEHCAYGPRERLEYALLRLDIRAKIFLELVSDKSMLNAYVDLLLNWERMVWVEFTGEPPELTTSMSREFEEYFRSIHPRVERWVKAGYQRMAGPSNSVSEQPEDGNLPVAAGIKATERREAVDGYLAEVHRITGKEITRADFWKAAGYKTRSAFERWQRNDPERQNHKANRLFANVLKNKPHLKN